MENQLPQDRPPTLEELDAMVDANFAQMVEQCPICGRLDDHQHEFDKSELQLHFAGVLEGIKFIEEGNEDLHLENSKKELLKQFVRRLRQTPKRLRVVVTRRGRNVKPLIEVPDRLTDDFFENLQDVETALGDAIASAQQQRRIATNNQQQASKIIMPGGFPTEPPNGRGRRG